MCRCRRPSYVSFLKCGSYEPGLSLLIDHLEEPVRFDDERRGEVLRRAELLSVPLPGEAIELLGEFLQGVGHGRVGGRWMWNRRQRIIHGVNDYHASPGRRANHRAIFS
jgi:hypothetical protein